MDNMVAGARQAAGCKEEQHPLISSRCVQDKANLTTKLINAVLHADLPLPPYAVISGGAALEWKAYWTR